MINKISFWKSCGVDQTFRLKSQISGLSIKESDVVAEFSDSSKEMTAIDAPKDFLFRQLKKGISFFYEF